MASKKNCVRRVCFNTDDDILIVDEQTKGGDIPSKVDVYSVLNEVTQEKIILLSISNI